MVFKHFIQFITLAYSNKWQNREPINGIFVFKYNKEYFYFHLAEVPDKLKYLLSVNCPNIYDTININSMELFKVSLAQNALTLMMREFYQVSKNYVLSYPDCDICGSIHEAKFRTKDKRNICDCCIAEGLNYHNLLNYNIVNRYVIRKGPFIKFSRKGVKRKLYLPKGYKVANSCKVKQGDKQLDTHKFPEISFIPINDIGGKRKNFSLVITKIIG